MVEIVKQTAVETELGGVAASAQVVSPDLVEKAVSLKVVPFKPKLPPGMSVRACTAILLLIDGSVEIERLSFGVTLDSDLEGSRATGERLDAQEWSDGANLVMIGAEDGEALDLRLPNSGFDRVPGVIYTADAMTLELSGLPKLDNPSFHFVIAEKEDRDPVDASAWFAVDQDHRFLLGQ
ncbi:hypothetical protein K1W69_05600 [Hoeflea sp. WL0058]|uniref:Uncharacterized protein n=1 Tax=Flavimaribacter sediminis TaxID=2865987 RepID=A0AAE2ZIM8_9HYPH|nr:hypothetical protein [Flavimaribacter sediminis]MBW8636659.1 hypothetical protein [Flavimaribacter sediminis]